MASQKVLYLYSRIERDMRTSGEAKKAEMQVDALKYNGLIVDLKFHDRTNKYNKIMTRLPFVPIYSKKFRDKLKNEMRLYDAIYIRRYIVDRSLIALMKEIKRENKIIIFEIPTYPYDKEISSFEDWPLFIKEHMVRNKIKKYVDTVVAFSGDKEIFGVPCIVTSNGFDSSTVNKRKLGNRIPNEINLLGVAMLEKWHGYDRLIRGMKLYYRTSQTIKIIFHIVGEGHELNPLKDLVEKLGLNQYVNFYGNKQGEELNSMFDRSDIGIGSLAMHRIGLRNGYTLKLREYMARGLPFIYGYDDKLIEEGPRKSYYKVPNNDDPINVYEIIDFYNHIEKYGKAKLIDLMNNYATNYLSWNKQMEPVARYIKEGR